MIYIAFRHNPTSEIGPKERAKICD